jgi:predicted RNA-binding protein YlxR (DUF448 family)
MCIGCGAREAKPAMLRIASLPAGIALDAAMRLGGRGGYLHPRRECLNLFARAKVREFRSLKRGVSRDQREALIKMIEMRLAPQAPLE